MNTCNGFEKRLLSSWALPVLIALLMFIVTTFANAEVGRGDFIAHWAAVKVAVSGGNAYNAASIYSIQHPLRANLGNALMMWNWPATILLLLPFGLVSFLTAAKIFLLFNILAYLSCTFLLFKAYRVKEEYYLVGYIVALVFIPFFHLVQIGQVSSFVLIFETILVYLSVSGRSMKPVIFAIPLALVKPHIVSLLLSGLLISTLKERKFGTAILITAWPTIILILTYLIFPSTVYGWFDVLRTIGPRADEPLSWRPVSLVSPIVDLLQQGSVVPSSRYTVGGVGVVLQLISQAVLLFILLNAKNESKIFQELLPYLAPLSCLVAPHIWMHDMVVLLPLYLKAFQRITEFQVCERLIRRSISLLVISQISIWLYQLTLTRADQLFWFPLLILVIAEGTYRFRSYRKV